MNRWERDPGFYFDDGKKMGDAVDTTAPGDFKITRVFYSSTKFHFPKFGSPFYYPKPRVLTANTSQLCITIARTR